MTDRSTAIARRYDHHLFAVLRACARADTARGLADGVSMPAWMTITADGQVDDGSGRVPDSVLDGRWAS